MCSSKNKCTVGLDTVGLDVLEKYVRAFAILSARGRHPITVPRGFPSDLCNRNEEETVRKKFKTFIQVFGQNV